MKFCYDKNVPAPNPNQYGPLFSATAIYRDKTPHGEAWEEIRLRTKAWKLARGKSHF